MLLLTVQCAVEIGSGYFMSRNGGIGGFLCHPMSEFKGLAAVGFCCRKAMVDLFFFTLLAQA